MFWSFAAKPEGVVTERSAMYCSPSVRESVKLKGACRPAVLLARPEMTFGEKRRAPSGHGAPFGSWPMRSVLEPWRVSSAVFQGMNSLSTWYTPQWVGDARMPRSDPKMCRSNSCNGACGRASKASVTRPVTGSASTRPRSLTLVAKPEAVSSTRYGSPGRGSARYRAPGIGAGRAATSRTTDPILAKSGHTAAASAPIEVKDSGQAPLPSAAAGLSEKPSGIVTLAAFISDGAGVTGLCVCGTFRLASTPAAVSVALVVGFTLMLGVKLGWLQPVVAGPGCLGPAAGPPEYSGAPVPR